jgi:O-antigen ligase
MIGSLGSLLELNLGEFSLSIRIGLFAAVFLVWLFKFLAQRWKTRKKFNFEPTPLVWVFMIFSAVLLFGLDHGLRLFNQKTVFLDFNNWLFLLFLWPCLHAITSLPAVKKILAVMLAATTWLAFKTILVLVLFSNHLADAGGRFYGWIRDTGVGEITHVSGTIFRIFFQSQIFVLAAFLIFLSLMLFSKKMQQQIVIYVYLFLASFAILISQSRSYWVGLAFGLLLLFGLAWRSKLVQPKLLVRTAIVLVILIPVQLLLLNVLTRNFSGNPVAGRFAQLSSEAGASSRINALPVLGQAIGQRPILGYGFGKELTYQSYDPRIVAQHPDGWYTTSAFEWGYLDTLLEIGMLGLAAYLIFITVTLAPVWRSALKKNPAENEWFGLQLGLLAGLAGLAATNIFSPYLNHPLGIGYIILAVTIGQALLNQKSTETI